MHGPQGQRTPRSVPQAVGDLHARVRALELAAASGLYKADALLDDDADLVVFDGIPGAALLATWLDWFAWSTEETTDAIAVLRLNGDDLDPENDYFWHVNIANPVGGRGDLTDDDLSDNWGAFGYIEPYAFHNVASVGRIVFPNPAGDQGDSLPWSGHGAASDPGAAYVPDTWTAGGYRQRTGPLTRLAVRLFATSDTTFSTPLEFRAGSRFTLVGPYA